MKMVAEIATCATASTDVIHREVLIVQSVQIYCMRSLNSVYQWRIQIVVSKPLMKQAVNIRSLS